VTSLAPNSGATVPAYWDPTDFDPSFPGIPDQGGAPARVLLRTRETAGGSCHFDEREEVIWPVSGKAIVFTLSASCRVLSAKGDQFTSDSRMGNLKVVRDDVQNPSVTSAATAALLGFHATDTMDTRYHVLTTTSPYGPESLDFPAGPVQAGSTWTGRFPHDTGPVSTLFRLDRIISNHHDTYAIITGVSPDVSGLRTRQWFNVTTMQTEAEQDLDDANMPGTQEFRVRSCVRRIG